MSANLTHNNMLSPCAMWDKLLYWKLFLIVAFEIIKHSRIQAEARKPGLQHHTGLNARNADLDNCEQQMRRPACASVQSDQRLCYLLLET